MKVRVVMGVAMAVILAVFFASVRGDAIPGPQSRCDVNEIETPAETMTRTGTVVTIDNGSRARNVLIEFSAETKIRTDTPSQGPVIFVRYSVDGGGFAPLGPEQFAGNAGPAGAGQFETHTAVAVVRLGPGSHTIEPGFTVLLGFVTDKAVLRRRCLVVEGKSR